MGDTLGLAKKAACTEGTKRVSETLRLLPREEHEQPSTEDVLNELLVLRTRHGISAPRIREVGKQLMQLQVVDDQLAKLNLNPNDRHIATKEAILCVITHSIKRIEDQHLLLLGLNFPIDPDSPLGEIFRSSKNHGNSLEDRGRVACQHFDWQDHKTFLSHLKDALVLLSEELVLTNTSPCRNDDYIPIKLTTQQLAGASLMAMLSVEGRDTLRQMLIDDYERRLPKLSQAMSDRIQPLLPPHSSFKVPFEWTLDAVVSSADLRRYAYVLDTPGSQFIDDSEMVADSLFLVSKRPQRIRRLARIPAAISVVRESGHVFDAAPTNHNLIAYRALLTQTCKMVAEFLTVNERENTWDARISLMGSIPRIRQRTIGTPTSTDQPQKPTYVSRDPSAGIVIKLSANSESQYL